MDFSFSNGIHIPHLSASTINSFITDRPRFYASKVLRDPFKGNVYSSRGTAVEHSINVWVETGFDDVQKTALDKYDEELAKNNISPIVGEEIRETIPGLALLALETYKNLFSSGKPVTQKKIETTLPGVKRSIIGYLDFDLPKIIRDSKVVSKTPSKLSQSYILQGALYKHSEKKDVVFDFFVPNKKPVHKAIELTDDDLIFGLSYLTAAAKVIEEIEECGDIKRMMELCLSFPNIEALYNMPDKIAAAKKWDIALK